MHSVVGVVVLIVFGENWGNLHDPSLRPKNHLNWHKTVDLSSTLSLLWSNPVLLKIIGTCQILIPGLTFHCFLPDSPLYAVPVNWSLWPWLSHVHKPKLTCSEVSSGVKPDEGVNELALGNSSPTAIQLSHSSSHCYKQCSNMEAWGWSTRKMV